MQTKEHLELGRFLIDKFPFGGLREHRAAFLLGCIEPDYNTATYARGMLNHKRFRGHNAENSLAHIEKCLRKLRTRGLQSAWSYFTLGTVLHYAADAFTWAHNEFWDKELIQHRRYEAALHELFIKI